MQAQLQTPTATAIAYPLDGSAVMGSPNANDMYSLGLENSSISNELDVGGNFFSQVSEIYMYFLFLSKILFVLNSWTL
jgi:hypothetical protein